MININNKSRKLLHDNLTNYYPQAHQKELNKWTLTENRRKNSLKDTSNVKFPSFNERIQMYVSHDKARQHIPILWYSILVTIRVIKTL